MTADHRDISSLDEESTLLHKGAPYTSPTTHDYGTTHDLEGQTSGGEVLHRNAGHLFHWSKATAPHALRLLTNVKGWTLKGLWEHGCVQPASYIPAVLLGLLLNILDALSYGWSNSKSNG